MHSAWVLRTRADGTRSWGAGQVCSECFELIWRRLDAKDVNCLDVVHNGVYGYCECLVNTISIDNNEEEDTNNVNDENDIGTKHIHLNISFYHQPFRCVDKCMAYYNVSF